MEIIETTSAAAIAMPVQADVQTSHQIETDVPREVTIAIKEIDPDDITLEQVENGYDAETNNESTGKNICNLSFTGRMTVESALCTGSLNCAITSW